MTELELQKQITAYFEANPLAKPERVKDLVSRAYEETVRNQLPKYVPTEVNEKLTAPETLEEQRQAKKYVRKHDEDTFKTPDFGDGGYPA